jgi:hypothetical protein
MNKPEWFELAEKDGGKTHLSPQLPHHRLHQLVATMTKTMTKTKKKTTTNGIADRY